MCSLFSPQNCPFPWGSWTPSNTCSLSPPKSTAKTTWRSVTSDIRCLRRMLTYLLTPVKNYRTLLEQSFTVHMLTTTTTFKLIPRLHNTIGFQTVVQPIWQPAASCKQTSNRVEQTATVRSTGCQTGLYNRFDNRLYTQYSRLSNRLSNSCMLVYTIQLVVKPVWQQVVSCKWGLRKHRSSAQPCYLGLHGVCSVIKAVRPRWENLEHREVVAAVSEQLFQLRNPRENKILGHHQRHVWMLQNQQCQNTESKYSATTQQRRKGKPLSLLKTQLNSRLHS